MWSELMSYRKKEWGRCHNALHLASRHKTTQSFSHPHFPLLPRSRSGLQFQLPLKCVFCVEQLQENSRAWQWPFHPLWTGAAGKAHPKVRVKEMVIPLVTSPAAKANVLPVVKLVHTVLVSLNSSLWNFPLCHCVGFWCYNPQLSSGFVTCIHLSHQWFFTYHTGPLAGEWLCESSLCTCPKTAISESRLGKYTKC